MHVYTIVNEAGTTQGVLEAPSLDAATRLARTATKDPFARAVYGAHGNDILVKRLSQEATRIVLATDRVPSTREDLSSTVARTYAGAGVHAREYSDRVEVVIGRHRTVLDAIAPGDFQGPGAGAVLVPCPTHGEDLVLNNGTILHGQ